MANRFCEDSFQIVDRCIRIRISLKVSDKFLGIAFFAKPLCLFFNLLGDGLRDALDPKLRQ